MDSSKITSKMLLVAVILLIIAAFYDKIFSFFTLILIAIAGLSAVIINIIYEIYNYIFNSTKEQFIEFSLISSFVGLCVAIPFFGSLNEKRQAYLKNNESLLKEQLETAEYIIEDAEREFNLLPSDYHWIKNSVKAGYGSKETIAAISVVINRNGYELDRDPSKLETVWDLIYKIEAGYTELRRLRKIGYESANISLALKYADMPLKKNIYIKKAARRGDRNANIALANYYYIGIHCAKNWSRARKYYKKALSCNVEKLNYRNTVKPYESLMEMHYIGGHGVKKDEVLAFNYALNATTSVPSSSLKSPEANYKLGLMLINGIGVEVDENKALEYFLIAADIPLQNLPAYYYIALILSKKIATSNEAISCLQWAYLVNIENSSVDRLMEIKSMITKIEGRLAIIEICQAKFAAAKHVLGDIKAWPLIVSFLNYGASNGHSDSLALIGEFHLKGTGHPLIRHDQLKGIEHLMMASDAGSVVAQRLLAAAYADGVVIKRDIVKAEKYFRQAISSGCTWTKCVYGMELISGDVFPADINEGLSLVKSAAKSGDSYGKYCLAEILYFGLVVDRSERELFTAIELLTDAVAAGEKEAATLLGYCYWWGIGCDQSYKLAFEAFCKSSDDDRLSNAYLGSAYSLGRGVVKNKRQAFLHTIKAADLDHMAAQYSAAQFFKNGDGVHKSETFFINYLKFSAEQGMIDAQIELASLYLNGQGVNKNIVNSLQWSIVASKLGRTSEYEAVKSTSDLLDLSGTEKANELAKKIISTIDISRNNDWQPAVPFVTKGAKISRASFEEIIYTDNAG